MRTREQAARVCAIWIQDRVDRTLREFYTTNNVEASMKAGFTTVEAIEKLLLQEFRSEQLKAAA